MGSMVGPAVTSIFFPARSLGDRQPRNRSKISSGSGSLPGPEVPQASWPDPGSIKTLNEDQQEEIHDYFMEAETDKIVVAIEEFDGVYDDEELRLYRIKFISEVAN